MKIDMSLVRSETTKLVAENDEEMAMSYAGSSSSGSSHKRFVSTSSSGLSELSPMELSSSLSKRVKTMSNGLSSSNNSPRSSPCSTSAASPPHSSSNSTTTTTSTNPTTIRYSFYTYIFLCLLHILLNHSIYVPTMAYE